ADYAAEHRCLMEHFPGLQICFTGHTHEQIVSEILPSGEFRLRSGDVISLASGSFFFINPGSVGEPRESDKRAAFLIHDSERSCVELHRVGYDRSRVLRENARRGLADPESVSIVTRVRGLVRLAASIMTPRDA